jgi:hypothetical protein
MFARKRSMGCRGQHCIRLFDSKVTQHVTIRAVFYCISKTTKLKLQSNVEYTKIQRANDAIPWTRSLVSPVPQAAVNHRPAADKQQSNQHSICVRMRIVTCDVWAVCDRGRPVMCGCALCGCPYLNPRVPLPPWPLADWIAREAPGL